MTLKKLLLNQPGNLEEFIQMAKDEGKDKNVRLLVRTGVEQDLGGQVHSTLIMYLIADRKYQGRRIKLRLCDYGYLRSYKESSLKNYLKNLNSFDRGTISGFYTGKLKDSGFEVYKEFVDEEKSVNKVDEKYSQFVRKIFRFIN
jgi:hypothetical protein